MKKISLIILVITASFLSGFAFNTIITEQSKKTIKMKKVTGIGGIFFKCKDPNKIKEWYKTHLGLDTNDYGATFEWRKMLTLQRRVLQHGVLLMKQQNILSLQQKTL
jgi:hypothetical protein